MITGTKTVRVGFWDFTYTGELDQEGRACGYGKAVKEPSHYYEGTWKDDVIHGLCT